MKFRFCILAAVISLALPCTGLGQVASPGAGIPPKQATVTDFAFISGHNRGESEGGIIDEHWSEPAADGMIGMFRYIKNGKVQRYEFLAIEMTTEGPVLRLKHFNPGLTGWEEKDQVYSYPLISLRPGEAVFERPDKGTRMTFRSTSKDTLEVSLERTGHKPEILQYAHTSE